MTVRIASISRSYKLKGHRRLQRQVHDPIATALRQRGASLWLNRLTFRTQLQEEWDVMVQPVDPSAASAFCGWISECLIKEIPENVQWLCDEGVASDIMINPRHCPRE